MVASFQKLRDYCLQININRTQLGLPSQYSVPDTMMKGFTLMELDSAQQGVRGDIEKGAPQGNENDDELADTEADAKEEDLWVELE